MVNLFSHTWNMWIECSIHRDGSAERLSSAHRHHHSCGAKAQVSVALCKSKDALVIHSISAVYLKYLTVLGSVHAFVSVHAE